MDVIYLDNNATTPMLPAVWEAMRPYCLDQAGNPASSHRAGRQARQALEDARERIAHLLDASPDEVLFTSGATEANNLAIFGLAGAAPGHLLASPVEHPCVADPLERLGAQGFALSHLPVTRPASSRGKRIICAPIHVSLPSCSPIMRREPFNPSRLSSPTSRIQRRFTATPPPPPAKCRSPFAAWVFPR